MNKENNNKSNPFAVIFDSLESSINMLMQLVNPSGKDYMNIEQDPYIDKTRLKRTNQK